MASAPVPAAATPEPTPSRSAQADRLFLWLCRLAGSSIILLAGLIVLVLIWQSWPVLSTGLSDFFTLESFDVKNKKFGALAYIYGTLITSFLAMLIAVPLGIGTAAYLAEIASPRVRRVAAFLVELLAAIPSVVYGFWGLFFLAPAVQWVANLLGMDNTGGAGIASASVILSIMIVPYITAITFDVCRAVPRSQRDGALALGATRWQMIWTSVLPFARPGIIAACFLALGRALGETMAVTMLVGNRAAIPALPQSAHDLLKPIFGLGDSIASVIANQLNETTDTQHRAALVGLGLLLFLVTIAVNIIARTLIYRSTSKPRTIRSPRVSVSDTSDQVEPPLNEADLLARQKRAEGVDRWMTRVLGGSVLVTLTPLFMILGYIVYRGVGGLSWAFFTGLPQSPGDPNSGLSHAFAGSFMVVALATLGAVPFGVLVAIYLAEYRASRVTAIVRFVTELLGGVPSIIIGIFAYALLVVTTGSFSGIAGSFALGVMMIPIVVRATEEALRLVPLPMRHASYALGASQWQTVLFVTLPAALPAIITGIFLAIGRIAGETAPLLLTAYGSLFWPRSPIDRTPTLPKYIYDYSKSGIPDWESQAWAAALVLVAVIMVLNVGIRLIAGQRVVAASRAD
ncbi:phosphate ABC transporter permease subunit PstC [Tuwongella immobilis]|uniref:Phosphate transport system permease protein PstA n=1 Tax=Tuwongella immobilis TaxID=692036 RepID=A0A6C2YPX5_9BACT|nr:phosphate ABC transporter permease subunit PstC [Tuwongella immobilis]VIP03444.1 phosphate abc transporter permease : Phosphate ABC transporter, permease protein PstC / phosphate ABC transporter, permease protein PstA multi-domain protein OS=Bordetella holmesii CDC-H635-BH GN=L499_A0942 PE=3 SV=1: BPD_transp_1: BPD_transp_1 [Tuwongella immobilis]VTS04260.1 phosphate abc transporter permease : Phosphate ABC transporter, permease protein PstC / phosphate ABC transporter, permease protein PstA mu